MRARLFLSIAAGVVIVLAGAFLALSGVERSSLTPPPQTTPIAHYGPESGTLSDTLISPDNVTLRVVEVQRGTTKWMFHIHVHNNVGRGVSILDASTDHYFMLAGRGTPGTPYTADQMFLKLAPPAQADLAAHPTLSATVASAADSDGWLAADLTDFKLAPYELLYVYGTVTAPACANLNDQSTCHPSTGYRTLVWAL